MKYNRWLFAFFALLFIACEDKKEIYPLVSSSSFFEFNSNTVLNYSGDSIIYDDFTNQVDSVKYLYKDSIVGIDTLGTKVAYEFERYISYPPSSTFQYLKNYTITKSEIGIIRVEDLRNDFLLPDYFEMNSTWNGNQYQLGDELIYTISAIEDTFMMGGNRKMVGVLQQNEQNLIEEELSIEKYANGLGLIYKQRKSITKDIATGDIKSGSIVILEYKP